MALFSFSLILRAPSATAQGTGQKHKIAVSDRQLLASLTAQGAQVVADYGSYVLLNANDQVANNLRNTRGAELVDDYNKVLLNSGAIDTQTNAAQTLRAVPAAGSGKDMRLIQFAGPIKSEWHNLLAATGARIVTYIPNNAYLVYGTAQQLQAVRELTSNATVAQWEGAYTAEHRLDPAVTATGVAFSNFLSGKHNEQFAIQLVEDAEENATTAGLDQSA